MSGPFGSSQFMYATGALAEGSSLRFEDGDSAYLSWTPASAGNRKTWTWSGWVKRGNLGINTNFMIEANSGNGFNRSYNYFSTSDTIVVGDYTSSWQWQFVTNQVFRDTSAWYHIVIALDTTQATSSDRFSMYVNGEKVTSFSTSTYPSLNYDTYINSTLQHTIGYLGYASQRFYDGYLANVAFIDGQALTPTSFGEYEDTLWKPKSDADITSLTMGTNGFYLPFKQTTEAEGFSTVTYTGTSSQQAIEGVGFEPDFVWVKKRSGAEGHALYDSVRGTTNRLRSDATTAENTGGLTSFDSNGFTFNGSYGTDNESGFNYVAWCWDAGTGSAVSNTDGSITSSVKANTAKGFSIVSYTGTGANATVGHGLTASAPEIIFTKNRTNGTRNWIVNSTLLTSGKVLTLNGTIAETTDASYTTLGASTLSLSSASTVNQSGNDHVTYCFHSVSGYSSIGSYSGTGASGNSVTGLGFKPAFVMIKRTDAADNWVMFDNTRDPVNSAEKYLLADLSQAEATFSTVKVDFDSDGFTLQGSANSINNSSGTYIYMAFADTRDATFFGDTSGNGNNWTPNKLNNTDVVPDSPVTNWCTLNPLNLSQGTLSEGNLRISSTSSNRGFATGTFKAQGKLYFEVRKSGGQGGFVGIGDTSNSNHQSIDLYDGTPRIDGSAGSALGAFSTGDICGVAVDIDTKDIEFFKNGSSIYTATYTTDVEYFPYFYDSSGGRTMDNITNFGQDSSFAGNETPQGNADDNGQGDFYYAPPSGFLALNRNNLPLPDILDPADYFNTVLYTGDGVDGRTVTGVNFSPNWVWIKTRSIADNHILNDSVRGGNRQLFSNTTDQEFTATTLLKTFDSDGFTLGTDSAANGSGRTFASWNWLAGGTAVSNTDGSGTSQVSANTDAGFSVVSYTGNASGASDDQTLGHGLTNAPEIMFVKTRDEARDWYVYCKYLSNSSDYFLNLNTTAAEITTSVDAWNGTDPTSSVFSVGYEFNTNRNGYNYIAYCFHSVENYSLISSYTGNGSTDGTFVHLGFRASWIMVKRTDASGNSWYIWDNKRNSYNANGDNNLWANNSSAENTNDYPFDALSNGFKVRATTSNLNTSGATYIFLAFAEAPFRNANAR